MTEQLIRLGSSILDMKRNVVVPIGAIVFIAALSVVLYAEHVRLVDVEAKVEKHEAFINSVVIDGKIPQATKDELRKIVREAVLDALHDPKKRNPEASH